MLTHNPLAEMYGPTFLLLYLTVIALTLIACARAVSRLDTTDDRRLPLVPTQPDPLEIAYLRGGENEVLRVAIFDLIQRGGLQVDEEGQGRRQKTVAKRLVQTVPPPEPARFSPVEWRVLEYFKTPHAAAEIFRSGLPSSMKGFCSGYEQALREEQLLFGDGRQDQVARCGWNAVAVILALGTYKLLAALSNGHDNVGFLIVMGLIGAGIVPAVCGRRRLTRRGKAFLARLQQAFDSLKRQARGRQTAAVLAGHHDPGISSSSDPAVLLLALYGTPVLVGTPHAYYGQMFAQSGGSGGCGDGSGGCGSSGGCGGGGDVAAGAAAAGVVAANGDIT